jgi:hypothetical protein
MYRNLTAKTALVVLALISSASVSPMLAQTHDVAAIDGIATELRSLSNRSQSQYRIVVNGSAVIIVDQSNGREIASIREVSNDRIVIRSLLATGSDDSDQLRRIIDEYNESAAVGTMGRDCTSGDLILVHNLNPKQVDSKSMARVSLLVADAARLAKHRCARIVATIY